jgi:hypothetical protein
MNEFVFVQFGSRFIFVNILPNLILVVAVGGLIAAGAPADPPTWTAFVQSINEISWTGGILIAFAVVAAAFVLHPLSYPLIQLLEGYWGGLPFGNRLSKLGTARFRLWWDYLNGRHAIATKPDDLPKRADLPQARRLLMSTTLGNVLTAGEMRAGARYGYESSVAFQRLLEIATPEIQNEVRDTRNQLDTAARLCVVGLVCVTVTTALLWSHEIWLIVPLGCYLFAWAAYGAAIAAARRFSEAAAVAFDFHHLHLWDALSLRRPDNLEQEITVLAPLLCSFLDGMRALLPHEQQQFSWVETVRPQYGPQQPGPTGGQPGQP